MDNLEQLNLLLQIFDRANTYRFLSLNIIHTIMNNRIIFMKIEEYEKFEYDAI